VEPARLAFSIFNCSSAAVTGLALTFCHCAMALWAADDEDAPIPPWPGLNAFPPNAELFLEEDGEEEEDGGGMGGKRIWLWDVPAFAAVDKPFCNADTAFDLIGRFRSGGGIAFATFEMPDLSLSQFVKAADEGGGGGVPLEEEEEGVSPARGTRCWTSEGKGRGRGAAMACVLVCAMTTTAATVSVERRIFG
jgi:hypothetical protein